MLPNASSEATTDCSESPLIFCWDAHRVKVDGREIALTPTEFSLLRALLEAGRRVLTQTGLVTGSPAYLSPEVASGASATPASDMWAWGATLYHAVCGERPFDDGDPDSRDLARRFPQTAEPHYEVRPGTHPGGAEVITACLRPDPAERPEPAEIADALAPVLDALPKGRLAGWKVR